MNSKVDEKMVMEYGSKAALNMEKGIKPVNKKVEVVVPEMLQSAMESEPEVLEFFNSMAPLHRRQYSEHIAHAKQEATQQRRLDKVMELLREKKGLQDKHKDC